MAIRPSIVNGDCTSVAILGSEYDIVKLVYDHIEQIKEVANVSYYFYNYLGAFAEAPTKRPDGKPLAVGDFYLNTETSAFAYVIELDPLEWVEVSPAEMLKMLEEMRIINTNVALHAHQVSGVYLAVKTLEEKASMAAASALASNVIVQKLRDEVETIHDDVVVLKDEVVAADISAGKHATDAEASKVAAEAAKTAAEAAKDAAKLSEDNAGHSAEESRKIYEAFQRGLSYGGPYNIEATNAYPAKPSINTTWDIILNDSSSTHDFDGKTWRAGDRLLFAVAEDKFYQVALSTGGVISVNGKTGVITLDAASVGALPIAGGTLTGSLNLHAAPTADSEATTKKYVDDKIGALDHSSLAAVPAKTKLVTTASPEFATNFFGKSGSPALLVGAGALPNLTLNITDTDTGSSAHARGIGFDYGSSVDSQNKVYTYRFNPDGTYGGTARIYTEWDKPTPTELGALGTTEDAVGVQSIDRRTEGELTPAATQPKAGFSVAFINRPDVGLGLGGYGGVINFRPYGHSTDFSGGALTQLGFGGAKSIAIREGGSGGWTSWSKVYTEANKPTAEELDVLPLSGGELTGPFSIPVRANVIRCYGLTSTEKGVITTEPTAITVGNHETDLILATKDGITAKVGDTVGHVYTTLNKPTPADINVYTKAEIDEMMRKASGVPVGTIAMFAHAGDIPDGFINLCVANPTFDTTLYPNLAKLYPDGNLPSYLDRYPRGTGQYTTPGKLRGWSIPDHNHTISLPISGKTSEHTHTHTGSAASTNAIGATTSTDSHNHGRGTMEITGTFGKQATDYPSGANAAAGAFTYSRGSRSTVGSGYTSSGGTVNFAASRNWSGLTTTDSHNHTVTIPAHSHGLTINSDKHSHDFTAQVFGESRGISDLLQVGNSVEVNATGTVFAIKASGELQEPGASELQALKDSITVNTTKIDGLTAADVGAVSKSGDTMTGKLTVQDTVETNTLRDLSGLRIYSAGVESGAGNYIGDAGRWARVHCKDALLQVQTQNSQIYRVYHEGHKPTPAAIGALGASAPAYTTWCHDTRDTNPPPLESLVDRGLRCDFKRNTADGYTAGGHTYHGVLTFRPYGSGSDTSGGGVRQIAFGDNGKMAIRAGTNAWDSWSTIYTSRDRPTFRDIESEPNERGETENLLDIISELRAEIADLKTKIK